MNTANKKEPFQSHITSQTALTLKFASILWLIWGIVHALVGAYIMTSDPSTGFQGIADAVNPILLSANYHSAIEAVLNQHAWNLFWGGIVTIIGSVLIWRNNRTAIWVTAMVGGLLDLGYFIFLDLGGYVNFLPGTLMTIISGSAILLSIYAYFKK